MFDIEKRSFKVGLKIKCKNVSLKKINNNIDKMNAVVDDGNNYYPKMETSNMINPKLYKMCVDKIISQIQNNLKYNIDDGQSLFTFNISESCRYTNYMYLAIFFGPSDKEDMPAYFNLAKCVDQVLIKNNKEPNFSVVIDAEMNFSIVLV